MNHSPSSIEVNRLLVLDGRFDWDGMTISMVVHIPSPLRDGMIAVRQTCINLRIRSPIFSTKDRFELRRRVVRKVPGNAGSSNRFGRVLRNRVSVFVGHHRLLKPDDIYTIEKGIVNDMGGIARYKRLASASSPVVWVMR